MPKFKTSSTVIDAMASPEGRTLYSSPFSASPWSLEGSCTLECHWCVFLTPGIFDPTASSRGHQGGRRCGDDRDDDERSGDNAGGGSSSAAVDRTERMITARAVPAGPLGIDDDGTLMCSFGCIALP